MMANTPVFHYFRIVLEAITPHGIQSGRGDLTHDVLLVRDANGLPAIPATSLAGVLRPLYSQHFNENAADQLFGYAQGELGKPSALNLTWGLINDSNNQAIEGIRNDTGYDPLLAIAFKEKPLVRQRVQLNSYGSAIETGKFDTTLVPAGARYTCFLGYWSDGSDQQEKAIEQLLSLLTSSAFRIGHGTRAGQGAFNVHSLHGARWDLTTAEGRRSFCKRPRQRAQIGNLVPLSLSPLTEKTLTFSLNLRAEAGWRIGGGEQPFSDSNEQGRTPDILPQSEMLIRWDEKQTASFHNQQALIPATAIKGALSHRLAFHYRCLQAEFAESTPIEPHVDCPAVRCLFGFSNDNNDDSGAQGNGATGRVIINDLYLKAPTATRQMHNRIDQFTGGVINGALFEEELLWQSPLQLELSILSPDDVPEQVRRAFMLTLEDLSQGWLPLGAGGSRGHGCFKGDFQLSDSTWSAKQVETV